MRIAVVADIHGNLPALETVVRDFTRRGYDAVVNLGDSVSGPLLPLQTAQFLMAQDWVHIAGNSEREILTGEQGQLNASDKFARSQLTARELAWMAALAPNASFDQEVFLCHGMPDSDLGYFLETVESTHVRAATLREIDARLGDRKDSLVLCGHTHVARSVRSSKGQLIVNPGSVGLPGFSDPSPFPHAIETGSPDARYALVEKVGESWLTTLIAVPYAHGDMARLAQERNREEWAHALATGYLS
jgi:predicted phosphodiesterase